MASIKKIRLFLWILVFGVFSELFCPPKVFDLAILRKDKPVDQQIKRAKKSVVRNFVRACQDVGSIVWSATQDLVGDDFYSDSFSRNPFPSSLNKEAIEASWNPDMPIEEKPEQLLPVPQNISFNDEKQESMRELAKSKLRRSLCRILAILRKNAKKSALVYVFPEEKNFLDRGIHKIFVTFSDATKMTLTYNPESKNWSLFTI